MGLLQRFENRLEQMVSGAFAKAFRSAVQPVEVAAALQREVDNSAQILSRNRRLVPNQFHVELSAAGPRAARAVLLDAERSELTEMLREHAQEQSYVFTGPVSIDFDERDDLSTGRFRVRSAALAKVTPRLGAVGHRHRRTPRQRDPRGQRRCGTRSTRPGIVIGRGSEADLRINDPGVSPAARGDPGRRRRHGPARDVSVVDLGSTNGMLVNGSRVDAGRRSTTAAPIKIGNTTMTVRLLPRRRARLASGGCLS